jgi:translocation and assembly module TamA
MKWRLGILLLFLIENVSAIEITGNHLFSYKDISHSANLNGSNDSLISEIQATYRNEGFFNARVSVSYVKNSSDRKVIIDEGRPSRIDSLAIELTPPDSQMTFDDLATNMTGQIASQSNLENLAEQAIARLAENGMPFASAQWRNIKFNSSGNINAALRVIAGPHIRIARVQYRGLKRTRPETLDRILNFKLNDYYCESKVKASERLLDQMPYLRIASEFEIEQIGDGDSCAVIFNTGELPSTRFDGAAGLSSVKGKSTFVGRLDLEFGDILGSGRAFGLFWNKKDRFSSEIRINYLEPYVLNSQFDLTLEAHQIDRDSLYIESGASLGLLHDFGDGLGGSLNLAVGRTVPETGSKVGASNGRSVGVQFDYIKADRPANPTTGYVLMTNVNYKFRSNQNSDSLDLPTRLTSAGVDLHFYAKASTRFVAAFAVSGWGIVSNDGQVPPDELHYIGGFESLRGYTEHQIPAFRYAIVSLEPRLITGQESRAYLFYDLAEVKSGQVGPFRFFPGYGLGLVAPTSLGQFKLEIGWGKNGFPSDAILNFGLAGRF